MKAKKIEGSIATNFKQISKMNFTMFYAKHNNNGKSYVVDGFMEINGNTVYTDCVIEDCDSPNERHFYDNDNTYILKCHYESDKFTFEVFMNGCKVEDYEIMLERARLAEDDPIWDVLGYEK